LLEAREQLIADFNQADGEIQELQESTQPKENI